MKRKLKIWIIDELHASFEDYFSDDRLEISYNPHLKKTHILNNIQYFDGIILRSKLKIDKEFVERAKDLLFVGRVGSGTDGIDKQLLKKHNITLLTAPEGNRNAVAEHTLGLILGVLNNFKKAQQEIAQYQWEREGNRGLELSNQTVGIIGYGNVGSVLAQKLHALGAKVLAYDKRHKEQDEFAQLVCLQELQARADIVSLHIPLDDGNYHFADYSFFDAFKKNIFFFNTSRGEVVQTAALIDKLKTNKIRGAGLDVLENEKLDTLNTLQKQQLDTLIAMPNVMLTPHVAGWTHESYELLNKVLAQKIKQFLDNLAC